MQEFEIEAGKVCWVNGLPVVPLYVSGRRPLRVKVLAPNLIEETVELVKREAKRRIDKRRQKLENQQQ